MVATLEHVTVHTGLVPYGTTQNCPNEKDIRACWQRQIARNLAALTQHQKHNRSRDNFLTTYERRRAAGICVTCAGDVPDGGARCPACRAYAAARKRQWRAQKGAQA